MFNITFLFTLLILLEQIMYDTKKKNGTCSGKLEEDFWLSKETSQLFKETSVQKTWDWRLKDTSSFRVRL